MLLHGFPDDVRTWDGVAPPLAAAGFRVVVPYLRGYGPTRYRDPATPRSGQQAALAADLLALMDALGIGQALLAGYDWGGRAACIVAALWPERVRGLVSATGYNIQDIARSTEPGTPERELRYWYQWYLHTERGAAGLTANRAAFCRLLWRMWSPTYPLSDAEYAAHRRELRQPGFRRDRGAVLPPPPQGGRGRPGAGGDRGRLAAPTPDHGAHAWCCTAPRTASIRRPTARMRRGISAAPTGGR